jgi:hypothetical protein
MGQQVARFECSVARNMRIYRGSTHQNNFLWDSHGEKKRGKDNIMQRLCNVNNDANSQTLGFYALFGHFWSPMGW